MPDYDISRRFYDGKDAVSRAVTLGYCLTDFENFLLANYVDSEGFFLDTYERLDRIIHKFVKQKDNLS